ncbi:hypothetical protein D3C87_1088330 [compost metagenome]
MCQADLIKQLQGPCVCIRAAHAEDFSRAHRDVLQRGAMGKQVETLEDHSDLRAHLGQRPTLFRQALAVQKDIAIGDGFQAVDATAQGRFPRA